MVHMHIYKQDKMIELAAYLKNRGHNVTFIENPSKEILERVRLLRLRSEERAKKLQDDYDNGKFDKYFKDE